MRSFVGMAFQFYSKEVSRSTPIMTRGGRERGSGGGGRLPALTAARVLPVWLSPSVRALFPLPDTNIRDCDT